MCNFYAFEQKKRAFFKGRENSRYHLSCIIPLNSVQTNSGFVTVPSAISYLPLRLEKFSGVIHVYLCYRLTPIASSLSAIHIHQSPSQKLFVKLVVIIVPCYEFVNSKISEKKKMNFFKIFLKKLLTTCMQMCIMAINQATALTETKISKDD